MGLALAAAALPCSAHGASSPTDAAAALAAKYRPVMFLAPIEQACDVEEDYVPAPVDIVLSNPAVELRQKGHSNPVLRAPKAADLVGLGPDYYLDYPGDPTDDDCAYATDGDRLMQGREPVVYADVSREEGRPGLALHYWFYFYFDIWVNVHEGDWEGIQIDFATSSIDEALRQEPVQVAYAQHGGGERAAWTSRKVRKEGSRPVVYVAPGSHASYFTPRAYFGIGGCDDTSDAERRIDPKVEVLAGEGDPVPANQAWVDFGGQWGDPRGGPMGPRQAARWKHPFTWERTLSRDAVPLPQTPIVGSGITAVFCPLGRELGSAYIGLLRYPPVLPWLVLALVLSPFGLTLRRRWTVLTAEPLRARHSIRKIPLLAINLYARHVRSFVPIGLVPVPFAGASALLALVHLSPDDWLPQEFARVLGIPGLIIAFVITAMVQSSTAAALGEIAAGRAPSAAGALVIAMRRLKVVVLALMGTGPRVLLYGITLIGAPWALKRYIDWCFTIQAATLTDSGPRAAWRRSAHVVKRSWWRTLLFTTAVWAVVLNVPVVLALPLLSLSASQPELVELFGVIAYGLLFPLAVIANTLLYFDLEARRQVETEPLRSDVATVRS